MWAKEEDFKGIWERWEPAMYGDWPSGDGVPERCCEGIVCRRKVHADAPPETVSPAVKAWVEKIPRDKEGNMWRYEIFHEKHCLAKRAPQIVPERFDGKAAAAGEDAA